MEGEVEELQVRLGRAESDLEAVGGAASALEGAGRRLAFRGEGEAPGGLLLGLGEGEEGTGEGGEGPGEKPGEKPGEGPEKGVEGPKSPKIPKKVQFSPWTPAARGAM
jgi:hypothetical protein